ncbi:beta-lactamase family protein [Micromonospora sp. CPCC 205371]|nr:beta-lactamase family protein [Micromonospora sp. CPCC 205371]
MYRSLVVLTAGVMALAGCTDDGDDPAPTASTAARCDPSLDAAFRAWARVGFSGTVAVSTGGDFDCLAAYGAANDATNTPNTVDTVFEIGSVTKAVTAASVVDLAEDGKLALTDPVGRLLPELKGPVAAATIEQLLRHTSGLTGSHGTDHEPLDRDAAVKAIGRIELAFKPGSGYAYSNAGYTLLALVIEKVSGKSYREYTASTTLRLPDGRTAGGFWDGEPAAPGPRAVGYLDGGRTGEAGDFAGPHWVLDGNGGVAMTVRDLATWARALFTGELVSPESAKAIAAPGHDLGKGRSEALGWVAFDPSVYGTRLLATAGGGGDVGHNAVVAWIPERQRVVAMASNKPDVSAEDLLAKMVPALLAGEPLPTPSPPPAGSGPAATVGRYELETGGTFDVTAAGSRVTVAATGADAIAALFPPAGSVTAGDFRANEERVVALLDGGTQEGREERENLEDTFGGEIRGVTLAGTLAQDGDIRTYVTITIAGKDVIGWYAVGAEGGIEAAEVPADPPALRLAPAGGDQYRPDDPTGAGPDVAVTFGEGRMTISGPAGTAVAKLAG